MSRKGHGDNMVNITGFPRNERGNKPFADTVLDAVHAHEEKQSKPHILGAWHGRWFRKMREEKNP